MAESDAGGAPTSFRRWADDLEGFKERQSWPEAKFAPTDSFIYFVIDGAFSASIKLPWLQIISKAVPKNLERPNTFRGFSYRSVGAHYVPQDTDRSLAIHSLRLREYLSDLQPGQRVLPICFSLGCALVLKGIADWIVAGNEKRVAEVFPTFILVAPPLEIKEHLLHGYKEKKEAGEISEVPTIVYEMCAADSLYRSQAIKMLDDLPRLGVVPHVIFSPADLFTPYSPINDSSRRQEHELTVDPPSDFSEAVVFHGGLPRHAETLKIVADILSIANPALK